MKPASSPLALVILLLASLPFSRTELRAGEQDLLARLDGAIQASLAFEHGKDSGPLQLAEKLVLESSGDAGLRPALEERILGAIETAQTRDARAFFCDLLGTIATELSVPKLEPLLADPDLSHMARQALERIDGPAADAALRRALSTTSGKQQAGILGSLGKRRSRAAVPEAARLLASAEVDVARAAAGALGSIGGTNAASAIQAMRPKAPTSLRPQLDDALLACADRFVAEGRGAEAVRIYEGFSAKDAPRHLRIAALRGLVAARGDEALDLIVSAIQDGDPEVRASALAFSRSVGGSKATKTLAALLPSLPREEQPLLLGALGERGDVEAIPAILAAAKVADDGVRAAAYAALGNIGAPSLVEPLLEGAAGTSGGVQQAARSSLLRLRGDGVDAALLRSAGPGDAKVRIEAIRALALRPPAGTFTEMLALARADDAAVRGEAIRALGALAGDADLVALVALVAEPKETGDRPALEEAVTAAVRRAADPEKRAAAVLAALPTAPAGAKPALIRILRSAGTPGALEAARAALKDGDPAVRDAALRAISEWPDAAPADDLLDLARTLPDAGQKAVALQGYIRLAALSKDPAGMYTRALTLAERADDRRLVLGGLAAAGSRDALDLVLKLLEDADVQVRAAAGLASVEIATRVRATDAPKARSALDRVIAGAQDPAVRQKAQEVLNEMDQHEGHILAWSISGPWSEKGKESRAIFDTVFPPEDPAAKDVAWKKFRKGIGAWDVKLDAALDPVDHCAAYVRTRIWAPSAQEARLEMGSDDAIRAWLNGQLVHQNYLNRGVAPRQDTVAVRLREGWNDLLLKVVNHTGPWACCCRVRKPDGTAPEGLKYEAP